MVVVKTRKGSVVKMYGDKIAVHPKVAEMVIGNVNKPRARARHILWTDNDKSDVYYYYWGDSDDYYHVVPRGECEGWVVPKDAFVEYMEVDQFADTFSPSNTVGIMVIYDVNCACGKFQHVDVGIEGTVQDFLKNCFD